MIPIKTFQEIEIMRQGGKILAKVLDGVGEAIKPGVTTQELDRLAEGLIFSYGAMPAFKGFKGEKNEKPYPATLCTSINQEIVHIVPSERVLKEGDIIGLDLGILYPPEKCSTCPLANGGCQGVPGLYTDAAITLPVGKVSEDASKLIEVTKKALEIAISQVKPGNHLGDISFVIQQYIESEGLAVIRDLTGHGIGHQLHEKPEIKNFGQKGAGPLLKQGMALAIEPMTSAGSYKLKKTANGFGFQTDDNSLSAHFEHTVVVAKDGCEVLTHL